MKFKDRINYLLAVYETKVYTPIMSRQKQTYLDEFNFNEAVI